MHHLFFTLLKDCGGIWEGWLGKKHHGTYASTSRLWDGQSGSARQGESQRTKCSYLGALHHQNALTWVLCIAKIFLPGCFASPLVSCT